MELQESVQTANHLMQLVNMNKCDIRKEMDRNYLQMLVDANPSLKPKDFVEFITKCQLTGADPRLNQIYLIVHDTWNKQTGKNEPKGTTVLSYQYFIKMAQQTGELEDFDVDIIEESYIDFSTGRKRPSLTAIAWVKRKGMKYKFKARLWEFAKTNSKDGSLFGNWKNSPYFMLEKCAVAGVMRWAFPEVLGNLYVADEMEKVVDTAQSQNTSYKKISEVSEASEVFEVFEVSDVENIKNEIKSILENGSINWVEKCGKPKDAILEKYHLAENNPEKLLLILDFCKRIAT